ncbi:hypothetical protein PSI15_02035 [Xenorhabdus sp. PR6a]|nr:hypothetical protein [Xenorhabdus sp. PR6a]MDC9580363.1 hypothetical protein [Xenorhabdus sp. PR6a]
MKRKSLIPLLGFGLNRHVNEDDTVPSVPFNKDMDNIVFQAGLE